jgi:hypothetical protein
MVFATTNQVHLLNQQLLNFQADDTLQRQEAVRANVPAEMSEEIRTRHAMYKGPPPEPTTIEFSDR